MKVWETVNIDHVLCLNNMLMPAGWDVNRVEASTSIERQGEVGSTATLRSVRYQANLGRNHSSVEYRSR